MSILVERTDEGVRPAAEHPLFWRAEQDAVPSALSHGSRMLKTRPRGVRVGCCGERVNGGPSDWGKNLGDLSVA